jgi:hypothetical protein
MQLVLTVEDLVPPFSGAVGALDVHLVRILTPHVAPTEFPVHGVVVVIAVAAIDDPVQALQALILVESASVGGELEQERVLLGRALVVGHLRLPANRVIRCPDLVAELLVVHVEAATLA